MPRRSSSDTGTDPVNVLLHTYVPSGRLETWIGCPYASATRRPLRAASNAWGAFPPTRDRDDWHAAGRSENCRSINLSRSSESLPVSIVSARSLALRQWSAIVPLCAITSPFETNGWTFAVSVTVPIVASRACPTISGALRAPISSRWASTRPRFRTVRSAPPASV